MKHLLNWIEIPVADMARASKFYADILGVGLEEMTMGDVAYAIFATEDRYNAGALAQGAYYTPGPGGVVIYLNGGDDLNGILGKVEGAGGTVLMPKTFLSDMAGYAGMFTDTEGNRIGVQSMA